VEGVPRFGRPWGAVLALGALLVLGPITAPAEAEGEAKPAPSRPAPSKPEAAKPGSTKKEATKPSPAKPTPPKPVTDYDIILTEFQSAGALKFYENTEDILRAGQFERAFSRYLFLKTQIRGQALYVGLSHQVDQRLHFLRSQLQLGERVAYSEAHRPIKKYQKKKKPQPATASCPPPKDQKGTPAPAPPPGTQAPATPGGEKPPDTKVTAAATPGEEKPPETTVTAPAAGSGEKAPEAAATEEKGETPPKEDKEPPAEEAKEKPPAPPPSFWEKAKRKLMFWK